MLASILQRDRMFRNHIMTWFANQDFEVGGEKEPRDPYNVEHLYTMNTSSELRGDNKNGIPLSNDSITIGTEKHHHITNEDLLPYIQRGFFSSEARLGRLFVTFLDTFGRRFDPQLHAVSVSNSEDAPDFAFSGAKYRHCFHNHTMVIIDPFNPNNNIGRTCFNIWQIQQVFSTALNNVQGKYIIPQQNEYISLLGSAFSAQHHRTVLAAELKKWTMERDSIPNIRTKLQSLDDGKLSIERTFVPTTKSRLIECSKVMKRKSAVTMAHLQDLQVQIKKRKEMNDKLISKAEERSAAVGKIARNGNLDTVMSEVEDLTSYLAWVNDQRRSNIADIDHLTKKMRSVKVEFYEDMKNISITMGETPFTIEQLQHTIQHHELNSSEMKQLVDRKTVIARWRIAQLEEDIEEMEQMVAQLEACAEYQAAKLAMQTLKASTDEVDTKAPRSESKSTKISGEFDGEIFNADTMHMHALDWCPNANVEDERLRTGNFLAWINQQNRVNHMQIDHLKAEVNKEKQQYMYEIARLAIGTLNLNQSPVSYSSKKSALSEHL
mmetsp:Transcript_21845/g.38748  ORF Transcript_21845/g.38748 Transcript_21845/m.38748 type:complete len:550 (+) Transcript_21845:209-1858(+)